MNIIKLDNTNKTVLDSLREDYNIPLVAPCGGKGTCGKCKVQIIKGDTGPIGEEEGKFLSAKEKEKGIRLACMMTPTEELHIAVDYAHEGSQILEDNSGFSGTLNPIVKKRYVELEKPVLADQRDDVSRLADALGIDNPQIDMSLRKRISNCLMENDYSLTAVYTDDKLLSIEKGNREQDNYAIACDIGTTTVVSYLLNAFTGEIIDTYSELNSQKTFGADVIARIDYTINNEKGIDLLQKKIAAQLDFMAIHLLENNDIEKRYLHNITIAGNTTMLHLLGGVSAKGIATAPFIPAFLKGFRSHSAELGISSVQCEVEILPSISGYVGADIVAGVLATSMFESDELSLLVDLGTNGEIILGKKGKFYSCSTAAGPAFEGAHISCGLGAVNGAVNTFIIKDQIEHTTIGDEKATGICGSGIVDIVAQLLESEVIDETGRFEVDELEDDDRYISKGEGAYVIATEKETASGEPILFTQKDIREVQLAKASVAAGIATLLNEADIDWDDVKHLYIAGGFGNYIDKTSAATMGLIPKKLLDRAVAVGNTSGLGAINCALSSENLVHCSDIVKNTSYVELSGSTFFQMSYMEEMIF